MNFDSTRRNQPGRRGARTSYRGSFAVTIDPRRGWARSGPDAATSQRKNERMKTLRLSSGSLGHWSRREGYWISAGSLLDRPAGLLDKPTFRFSNAPRW